MNLDHCPRCGKLYAKNFRDLCPSCIKEIDNEYELCADYLRKNRGITTQELANATGVSVKQITRFIREGRISIAHLPNLTYECDSCGRPIRDGNMCIECRHRLMKDIKDQQIVDARKDGASETRPGGAYQIGDRLKDRL